MINENQLKALLAVAAVVWGVLLLKAGVHLEQRLFEPIPTVAGVVLVVAGVFDRYLWRWRVWRPWLVQRPDVRGTWRSTLTQTHGADGAVAAEPRTVYFAIRQTFSTLTVRLISDESASQSLSASIARSEDGLYRILVVYNNQPRLAVRDSSPVHLGAMALDVHEVAPATLSGQYWTDRRSMGEVRLGARVHALHTDLERARAAFSGDDGKP